jgi:hypothetical protein
MGGGDGGDQRVGISVQLWVGFHAEQGLIYTSDIVSVNSMFPVFAIKIRRRNASNLSADGSFMSDFGLYRSSTEGELSGKVTSVCGSGVGNGLGHTTNKSFQVVFIPGKRRSLSPVRESQNRYP